MIEITFGKVNLTSTDCYLMLVDPIQVSVVGPPHPPLTVWRAQCNQLRRSVRVSVCLTRVLILIFASI